MGENIIKHANIVYVAEISVIGGVETFVYEMVKKYHDLDIAVVCKQCDPLQAKRIKKYCRLYKFTGQKIDCKVIVINHVRVLRYIKQFTPTIQIHNINQYHMTIQELHHLLV